MSNTEVLDYRLERVGEKEKYPIKKLNTESHSHFNLRTKLFPSEHESYGQWITCMQHPMN